MARYVPILPLILAALLFSPRAAAVENWEEGFADVLTGVVGLGSGYYAHKTDDKEGRRQWFVSTLVVLHWNTLLRVAFNDHEFGERPNGHPYGFPSGHVAFMGAGANFLQERYGWRYGLPAWLLTGYVGYVRVETDHHKWRDVATAAVIAYGISNYYVSPLDESMQVGLLAEDEFLGLRVRYDW